MSGDAIWLVSTAKGLAIRVNGYSNVVEETVKVGPSPIAIASGEGSVWTLNGGDGSLSRIDPKTNKVTETIKAGITGASGTILVGEGSVWVSAPGSPLARIDPRTNTLAQRFTGAGGGVFALGLKSIWLAATPTHIWRIDPKRVEATQEIELEPDSAAAGRRAPVARQIGLLERALEIDRFRALAFRTDRVSHACLCKHPHVVLETLMHSSSISH